MNNEYDDIPNDDEYTYDDFLAEPEYVGEDENDYENIETEIDGDDEVEWTDEQIEEMIRTGECCGGGKWKGFYIDQDELEERNELMVEIKFDVENGMTADEIQLKYIDVQNKYLNVREYARYLISRDFGKSRW